MDPGAHILLLTILEELHDSLRSVKDLSIWEDEARHFIEPSWGVHEGSHVLLFIFGYLNMLIGRTFRRWLDHEGMIIISGLVHCWIYNWLAVWKWDPWEGGGLPGVWPGFAYLFLLLPSPFFAAMHALSCFSSVILPCLPWVTWL